MLYRHVERHIRTAYGDSLLDDWIVECGGDILTKIIAFNLFCDFHYEPIPQSALLDCALELEEELRNLKNPPDPIDRLKGLVTDKFHHFWDSKLSDVNGVTKLSRVLPADRLVDIVNLNDPRSTKAMYPVSEKEVQNVIGKFKDLLDAGLSIELSGHNDLVWFSPTDEIEKVIGVSLGSGTNATVMRDLLGLGYLGCHLIGMEFSPDGANHGMKPTVFHSEFNHMWKSVAGADGWGMTLNLQDLLDGVRESIRKKSSWPKCEMWPLGVCTGMRRSGGWEDYFESRLDEFRVWAAGRVEILEDLDYFQGKW